jgi:hypothetical protein
LHHLAQRLDTALGTTLGTTLGATLDTLLIPEAIREDLKVSAHFLKFLHVPASDAVHEHCVHYMPVGGYGPESAPQRELGRGKRLRV